MPKCFDLDVDIALGMTGHKCIKCAEPLNKNNWTIALKKQRKYVCKVCQARILNTISQLIKEEVINHYGGICSCCKESNLAFLTIDHIDGKGAAHRRSLQKSLKRKKNISSGDFYRWLKKNNYPNDNYQVLCFNCNCAKHMFGTCPHQKNNT